MMNSDGKDMGRDEIERRLSKGENPIDLALENIDRLLEEISVKMEILKYVPWDALIAGAECPMCVAYGGWKGCPLHGSEAGSKLWDDFTENCGTRRLKGIKTFIETIKKEEEKITGGLP